MEKLKTYNNMSPRREVLEGEFPPSSVSKLGFASIGDRIRAMIDHGKLIAENNNEGYEFDDDEEGLWADEKDVPIDPSNDISLDKMDAMELSDSILRKMDNTKENLKNSSISSKKSNELEEKIGTPKALGDEESE